MDTLTGIASIQNMEKPAQSAVKTSQSGDFSNILAEALRDELTQNAVTMQLSGSSLQNPADSFSSFMSPELTIESLITNASETGQLSDVEMALFMLCAMLQSSGDSSDLSPIMSMMATMLQNLGDDTSSKAKQSVLGSDYPAYVLSTVDSGVFKTANPPDISATGSAIVPAEAWKPTSPAVVSDETNRSPGTLRAVIDQFSVESSERYRPYRRGSDTYCNIFLWDVTSALNCEIPHFIDPSTGNPRKYPDIDGAIELDAEGVEYWLVNYGQQYGWREVDAETAQNFANAGKPAVTTAGDIGHVQVVCPSQNGGFDPILGVSVAQSGSRNISYTYTSNIFSAGSMSKVRYFVHE